MVMADKRKVRVALVHDYLNQFGGAERVILTLAELFPDAPIYTLFYDPDVFNGRKHNFENRIIKTSFLNHPLVYKRHRFFIPLFPTAMGMLDLGDEYDLIISSSASYGQGIRYKNGFHISYVNAFLGYAWEPETYLGPRFSKLLVTAASPLLWYLRHWDKKSAQKPRVIIANSNYTAQKIKIIYNREAEVLHPPVDTEIFYPDKKTKRRDYFLAFGRLMPYKRFDIIVRAFNALRLPLKIVGSGPEEQKIKKLITSSKIELLPEIRDDNKLREIISGAKALIFPQIEYFGLIAAEALACGTPIIAYRNGGSLEIVEDGINGVFFNEQAPKTLANAIKRFDKMSFSEDKVAKSAQKFSKDNFKINFLKTLKEVLKR